MRKTVFVVLTALAVAVAIALLRRGQPGFPAASVSPDSEPSLDGLTRDELYGLAQERDIPGRSKMKKDELRDALRRA